MKILFFSHQAAYIFGGEICTLEMMRVLRARHQVYFAAPAGPYFERAREVANAAPIPSVEFRRQIRYLPKFFFAFLTTNIQLWQKIHREKIDILHATSLKSMVYVWLLGFFRCTRVVWHHHDILPPTTNNQRWLRAIARGAAKIITPSIAGEKALIIAGIPAAKIVPIHNGFAPERWRMRNIPEKRERFVVGMIGEISERKGADWIALIAARLWQENPWGFVLKIVGTAYSDPDFGRKIESQNQIWIERGAVEFLGRQENIPSLLQDFDLLIVPSRQDPLPTVIIEAAFSGVPSLATNVGGIPEMICDGENGYLCNSPEDFAEKIMHLARHRQEIRCLSENARVFAELHFSSARMAADLEVVYRAAVPGI